MSVVESGQCFICRNTLDDGKVIVIKEKGIATLSAASVKRGLHDNVSFLKGQKQVHVHDNCRKKYTEEKMISASVRRGGDCGPHSQKQSLRSSSGQTGTLKNICFLCGDEISEDFIKLQARLPISRRNPVHSVEKLDMQKSVLAAAEQRGDEWGQTIIKRIENVNDLVAADARYHHCCQQKLYQEPTKSSKKRGYRPSTNVDHAMENIFLYITNSSEECQFSLDDLMGKVQGEYVPDHRTVKTRLKQKYGDDIVIAQVSAKKTVVCLKNVGHKILHDSWYENKKNDAHEERLRVVKAAAEIILEDIRSEIYNNSEYPPSDDFLRDANSVIPDSLRIFLDTVILKHKRAPLHAWKNKCIVLAHSIISAVRPRSFISSLLTGVSAYLYRKFGSKLLVKLCSALGFASSYNEAGKLEASAILLPETDINIEEGAFLQFVFDNADVNVNTIDGLNTFHEMGGIMCVTPHTALSKGSNIPRLKEYVSADAVRSVASIEIKQCKTQKNAGLSAISITDLQSVMPLDRDILPLAPDLMWLLGKWSNIPNLPGWNGFMEQVTTNVDSTRSKIMLLPFIRSPPGDYDTLLTALFSAREKSNKHSLKTCFVTFDQPLYMKSRDILESGNHPELRNVEIRLGGFHLLMSFMGSIGNIMAGSGLKEVFNTIYAENSVDKMLSGHAYSRAVRAHLLTNLILVNIVLNEVQFTEDERADIESMLGEGDRSMILLIEKNEKYQLFSTKFSTVLKKLEGNGPTSKLWVQYIQMTVLIKHFIQAERAGDWNLHITTISKMLPFFHAAGHFLYAKSAHLYLQDMLSLEERMDPAEFHKFTTNGCFTIRRSDKFWSGIWSDMTIEQVLMKSMKSYGGLTHGRGITDSVLSRWTMGMTFMQNICEGIETFCELNSSTTEQHVDMRSSRIVRDDADVQKLRNWFTNHHPFPKTDKIISISSGLVGGKNINCHMAQQIGIEGISKIVGNNFGKVSFKRKDKVTSLAAVTSTVKVGNKKVEIDPLSLFQRVCIMKQSDKQLEEYFKYELAPFPLSLFTAEGMRKGTKSSMYTAFNAASNNVTFGANTFAVVDGGYLLHKVVWHRNDSVGSIITRYVNYVQKHFGSNVCIVFDGYPVDAAQKNTKSAERARRSTVQFCADIILLDNEAIIPVPQEKFLTNEGNKQRLIALIYNAFEQQSIEVKQAVEDADVDIVNTAISKVSAFNQVIIIGEDIDLLVLLTGLATSVNNVYLYKRGRGESAGVVYSSSSFKYDSLKNPPGIVLFLHAVSGCDTTSAIFGQGKIKGCTTLQNNTQLKELVSVFTKQNSSPDDIAIAGEKYIVSLFGGDMDTQNLDNLRYQQFRKGAATSKINLARLPPTQDAARFHSYRTYHAVQKWLGFEINPLDWGWMRTDQGLAPIHASKDPAPQDLLKFISCRCKTQCRGPCSCKKAGLNCSSLCTFCIGQSCQNACTDDLEDSDEDELVDVITDTSPLHTPVTFLSDEQNFSMPGPSKKPKL